MALRIVAIAISGLALKVPVAFGEQISPAERLGREIYRHGKGNSPIEAFLGDGRAPVASSVVPCASCHGVDGHGRPEGGIVPADITATTLAAELDAASPRARRRLPYTDRLLKRAISMGIDSSGNHLDATMPRYQMSSQNMSALMAYLKKVGDEGKSGVTADSIRIGVLLPPREYLPGVHDAVRRALQAFFDARNAAGSIYDRKIALVFADCDGSPSARAAAAAKFVDDEKPFALVGSFTDGADEELAAVAEERAIPLLATISSHARSDASSRYVRDLVAGLREQTRALAQYIGRRFPDAHVAVLHEPEAHSKQLANTAVEELRTRGIVANLAESSISPKTLKDDGVDAVLYVGATEALAKLAAATNEMAWSPAIFVSAALIPPDALDRSHTTARFYIALPIGPEDQAPAAVATWRKLIGEEGAAVHRPSQFAALASAKLLVAALERAGRDLTRETLLSAIDGTTALETGFVPPLTYTPARRIGSTGAYVVSVNDQGPEDERIVWVDPD